MHVAVVGGIGGGGHLLDGHHAAVGDGAVLVLELDGGVADVEVVFEHMVEAVEDGGALRGGNVGDGDVAGQGAGLRAQAPDVEVVDIEDAGYRLHVGADVIEVDAAGRAFKEDVEGFADDADRGPEDERGDDEREDGVDPVVPGEEDAGASGDDGGGGK